ncbi:MAG: hypothetical protein DRI61_00535 [Chloroflexi bacterium]|nr:MAG: hypothetical protein DRI61_00535 [Chloroflexota bacterium]
MAFGSLQREKLAEKMMPILLVIALAGYWAPWVNHKAVALVLTGLDMGEYVKFLPQVRSGEVRLIREVFYLPLFCSSISLTLLALNSRFRYYVLMRGLMLFLAWTMALAMLPPVWTPRLLLQPEFRKQTLAIGICLLLPGLYPWLRNLPPRAVALAVGSLALPALILPMLSFRKVLPFIAQLYGHPLTPGWGVYLMGIGFGGVVILALIEGMKPSY